MSESNATGFPSPSRFQRKKQSIFFDDIYETYLSSFSGYISAGGEKKLREKQKLNEFCGINCTKNSTFLIIFLLLKNKRLFSSSF